MKYLGLKFGLVFGCCVTYIFVILNLFIDNLSWETFFMGLGGGIISGVVSGIRMKKSIEKYQ